MAIRIERDEPQGPRRDDDRNPRKGGGSNPIMKILPFLALIFFKNPKLGITILVIGGALYYFTDGFAFLEEEGGTDPFSLGLDFNQEKYDETRVFPALASDYKNSFPTQFSLASYAPTRLNQGRQGSCVGWASAYAARTILHSRASGETPDDAAFSPAFLYNQIALEGCQGAYLMDAMETMKRVGALDFEEFSYDERTCAKSPDRSQIQAASSYRIRGYNRLSKGGYNYKVDIEGIRQNLSQGAPVVIGMQVGGTFMNAMRGKRIWKPTQRDYSLAGFSGHAMCVIGYDDNLEGGAFQIMNSWGEDWGQKGLCWVTYRDFEFFVKEAYGLAPMGVANDVSSDKIAVNFGLVDKESQRTIPLKRVRQNVYRTVNPMQKEQRFKLEVTNSTACNIYIVTEELNGSSTVLFPYEKYSPYCGITGTRLFPKDQSLYPDSEGSLDRFAIIVTKEEIDIAKVNQTISASRQQSFEGKIIEALGAQHVSQMAFTDGNVIDFSSEWKGKNAVSVVIEVDKR